jgi:hypothetical protein
MMVSSKHTLLPLYVLLVVAVILLLVSLFHRPAHVDDGWFAEQAYWLTRDGVVRSEFFAGVLDYGQREFVYHKLHVWQSALVIELFGLSLYTLKAIPLVYFAVFITVLFFYLRRAYPDQDREIFLLSTVFLVSNGLVVEHAFVNRPEMMLMCLGFLSFIMLRRAMKAGRVVDVLLSGVWAGMAALAHLNGLVFVLGGAVLLVFHRRYRLASWFCIAAAVSFGAYFIELFQGDHLARFWYQFRHDPALTDKEFSVWLTVGKLLHEPRRYFGHLLEGSYSLLAIVVLIWQRKRILAHPEARVTLQYLLLLMVFVALLTPGKKNTYLLYHMPYVAILLGFGLRSFIVRDRRLPYWLVGLSILFLLVNYVDTSKLIARDGVTPATNAKVVRRYGIEPGARVMAPMSFVFNQLGQLQLRGVGSVFMRAHMGEFKLDAANFFAQAHHADREYVLLNCGQLSVLGLSTLPPGRDCERAFEQGLARMKTGAVQYGYRYLGQSRPYYVFKAMQSR